MRWFSLEVQAIDPFLSSLPIEQQNQLKNDLSQKLFGQNRSTVEKSDGDLSAATKSLSDFLANLPKATGRG
jgi:hypothetical protein